MKMRYIFVLLLAGMVFTGCAMKDAPPQKVYTLDAGSVAQPASYSYRSKVLKVSYPQALKESLTDEMHFSYSISDRGVYQNSRWSNNLGKLLQGEIIRGLQEARLFKAVLPSGSSADSDLNLESLIYDFSHHVREGASYAVVSIEFILVDVHTGRVLKSKRFSYREVTPTVNAEGYVIATNRAMTRLMQDVVAWLY